MIGPQDVGPTGRGHDPIGAPIEAKAARVLDRLAELLGLDAPPGEHVDASRIVDAVSALREVARRAAEDSERAWAAEQRAAEAEGRARAARVEADEARAAAGSPGEVLGLIRSLTPAAPDPEWLVADTNRRVHVARLAALNTVMDFYAGPGVRTEERGT